MEYTLRPAEERDWEWWCALHHLAERATVERQFGAWDEALQDGFARDAWNLPHGTKMVVEVEGQPAGYWHAYEKPDSYYVANVVIHPDYQGKGLGRKLLQSAIRQAGALGKPVTLKTLFENTARTLYEKEGFKVVGKTETHWCMSR